jgi:hypothetical protein
MAMKPSDLVGTQPGIINTADPGIKIDPFQKKLDPKPTTSVGAGNGNTSATKPTDIKVATPDVVKAVHDKAYSNEKVMQALFEDMGLQEILSVTRNTAMNIVNGQNVLYQPIENIGLISLAYNSLNILPIQSADTIFKNFSISLEDKLVSNGDGTGPSGESEYIDETYNLVINITNLQPDEFVEIESLNIESLFNDTIYVGATS